MVRQLLLDADGVVQSYVAGWPDAFAAYVGSRAAEFAARVNLVEAPALAGRGDFLPALGELLAEFGVAEDAAIVHDRIWLDIVVDAEVVALVAELRGRGVPVHLASNQRRDRAESILARFGYADRFDRCFFSHALGAVKPDPAYFAALVADLGAEPEDLVFVDDVLANVEAASAAGIDALHWSLADDLTLLRHHLAEKGFPL